MFLTVGQVSVIPFVTRKYENVLCKRINQQKWKTISQDLNTGIETYSNGGKSVVCECSEFVRNLNPSHLNIRHYSGF